MAITVCVLLSVAGFAGSSDCPNCNSNTTLGSGLAWDKHDFDVTNNKGGDVKVEVNLAAPISSDGGGDDGDDGSDLSDLLRVLTPEDPVNPIDMMSMMKQLIETMRADDTPPVNVSDLVSELKSAIQPPPQPVVVPQPDLNGVIEILTDVVRELKHTQPPPIQQVPYPYPVAPAVNPETIINALQPPPPAPIPPQPVFNIGDFMREMRETLAANKPPPPPPSGLDPTLADFLKTTMSDLKSMQQQLNQTPTPAPPPPPPQPVQPATQSPVPAIPQPPPPPIQPAVPTTEAMKDMIMDALNQIKPPVMPVLPPSFGNSAAEKALDELKALMGESQLAAQKPIILPPPIVSPQSPSALSVAPPPPPPPPSKSSDAALKDIISNLIPKPQRIPAPPQISITTTAPPLCCPSPLPDDHRPDSQRCPLIDGAPRPRCKRESPPELSRVVKCQREPCLGSGVDSVFNPRQLLNALCPGGVCPGQDPAFNRGMTQTGSL